MTEDLKNVESLVIGANGLIGRQLARLLTKRSIRWKGTFKNRSENGLLRLDITSPAEVKALFAKISPKGIFHCANLAGGVDFCQSNPTRACDFHLNATEEIGIHCQNLNATLVFISSDYIFDGTTGPYKEGDEPNPLNVYGRLKLQAEQWIQRNLEKYLIIRTSNVYGWDPQTSTPNYVMNLYRSLKDKRRFSVPSFLWGNPTYVGDITEAIVELYMNKANGVFHIVGSSFINRFEWAQEACKLLGLDYSLIDELKQPKLSQVARPLKSCLNTDKFTSSYKTTLHDVCGGLRLMKLDVES